LDAARNTDCVLIDQAASLFAHVRTKVCVMSVSPRSQDCIDRLRCPDLRDLPRDTVILLHNSLVHIVRMRKSIEVAERQLELAKAAARDSECLLAELRKDGF